MIEVKKLEKHFGMIRAVDNISFSVKKGEVLGFLGPNGAGKSTTMKIIAGFILPTSGDVLVGGKSVLSDPIEVKKQIGYMPENAPLYDDMIVEDFLKFMVELRELPEETRASRIAEIIDLCFLQKVKNQKIETLSKGFRRRLSFAQALIHDPEILILDEPTDGLDPNQKYEVRELIKKLGKNKCIILSTHILDEVEAVCSRAIIISEGKILFDDQPHVLKQKSDKGQVDDVFRAITTNQAVEGVIL